MITKDVFDRILIDIRNEDAFLDVEKADFMSFLCQLYPCYSSKELQREIQNLD